MRQKNSSNSKILNSKLFFIVSLVVLVSINFGLFKIIYKRIQIKKEVSSLDEKIQTLEKSNTKLTHLIDYLNTDAFKEKTARSELGLKKPDEKVVVIVKQDSILQNPISNETSTSLSKIHTNPQKWWQYFFE